MKLLSREMIVAALESLALELAAIGSTRKEELALGGGAALILLFNARDSTRDVDFCSIGSADSAHLRDAARHVATNLGLPDDWLNDGMKGYLNGILLGEVLLDRPTLLVRTLAPQQLLAMKLSAWRDDVDIEDARLLLPEVQGSRNEVWAAVEPFLVPGRELKARYAFDDLWERTHGS